MPEKHEIHVVVEQRGDDEGLPLADLQKENNMDDGKSNIRTVLAFISLFQAPSQPSHISVSAQSYYRYTNES